MIAGICKRFNLFRIFKRFVDYRDKNGKLESYDLIWKNTKFNTEICDDVILINKVGQMYLKWLELEKEIKQKKYEMKLNRIKSDF